MKNCPDTMSKQEFEFQTENIDKRAFKRRKAAKRAALVVILCIAAAAAIWGAVKGVQFLSDKRNEKIAAETYGIIRDAKIIGCSRVGETVYTDILNDITDFSLENDNTVKVWILGLSPEKEEAFKKAFPDAKRVVFKEGTLLLSSTKLTDTKKTANNVHTEIKTTTPFGVTFVIENTSKHYTYEFGDYYYIDRYADEDWYSIPVVPELPLPDGVETVIPTYASSPAAATLLPGESSTVTVSWLDRYGRLPAGKYRLVKTLSVQYLQEKYDDYAASYTVAVEFEIK